MQKIVVEFCYLIKKYYVCNVKNKNSMTGTAQISVILPFCNSKRTLAACVESILSQSYSHFELLVADYGSTDGSDKIINTFEDQRIRVVKRVNGYARALNSLVEQAEGKHDERRTVAKATQLYGTTFWRCSYGRICGTDRSGRREFDS